MSDADVVREVLAGRHESFGMLVERHFVSVYALCLSYVRNTVEAEDVAQETFVRCYNRLDTLKNPRKFAAWLASIARNICINHIRVDSRRRKLMTDYAENGVEHVPTMDAERRELLRTVRRAVDTLPAKTREAIYLYYFEEKSLKEIGAFLGKSPNAISGLLKYGRRKLKDTLWEEAEELIKELRPRKEAVANVCAAVPLGRAVWCTKAGTAAAGAGKLVATGGALTMSTKSVVSAIAVVVLVLIALFAWSPWSDESATLRTERTVTSRTDSTAADSLRAQTDPAAAPSTDGADHDTLEPTDGTLPGDQDTSGAAEEAAHQPDEEQDEADPLPASVSGLVIDEQGYPFPDASIYLEVATSLLGYDVLGTYDARTDTSGRYEIAGIDTFGEAIVYASAKGHAMQKRFGLTLSPGTHLTDVNFKLARGRHFVAGEVVTETGSSIPGAKVDLRHYGYNEEDLAGGTITGQSNFAFVLTDEAGQFEIAVEQEGLCDFTVTKDGYGTGFFTKIPTGTENARFVLESGGGIAGTVTLPDGSPVAGARIEVLGSTPPGGLKPSEREGYLPLFLQPRVTQTGADGTYLVAGLGADYVYAVTVTDAPQFANPVQFHTVPGDEMPVMFRLIEEKFAAGPGLAMRKSVEVQPGEITDHVDFVLYPTAHVYGRVTDIASGRPIARLGVAATASEAKDPVSALVGFTWTDGDGLYELRLSTEGHATVSVLGVYVSNGGADMAAGEENVLELEPGTEVELNFTVDAPMLIPVRTVDRDGTPLSGVATVLRKTYPDGRTSSWASVHNLSDEQGRFTWFGLGPDSEYVVMAMDISTETAWRPLGQTQPITGQPGETVPEVAIVCTRRGGIEGVLTDAEGIPVPDREVSCIGITDDGEIERITVSSDQNGAFTELWALPEGYYSQLLLGHKVDDHVETTVIENVEIQYDGVAQLGVIQPVQQFQSLDEAAANLGAE